ncbi:MAG TPA: ABC transporter substrate-binding protein [Tepidiformaceae bacterium]
MNKRFRRPLSILLPGSLALIATVLAAACGGGNSSTTATTQPTVASTAASSPTTASARTTYPVTVTDMAGKQVTIKAKPTTIVAVSPTAAEMVYAAGGTIVGRSTTVIYPDAAKTATDIGSAYTPAADKILALKPDLVVADSVIILGMPDVAKTLNGLGVPVVYVGAQSYADVLTGLDLMGKVLDGADKTAAVKAGIDQAKNDAKAALAGKNLVFVALTADEKSQLYAAKDTSYVGDIMKQLGINNPAATLPDTPPYPGYSLVATDKLLQMNPDFILAITPDPHMPSLAGLIPQIPPLAGMKAVTGKHVVDADMNVFLQAPGPRIVDAFKAITAAVNGK